MTDVATDGDLQDDDPRIRQALAELRELILASYPTAAFSVARGNDPVGIYLTATIDVEDLDEVLDTFLERLVTIQVDDGLPVYVVLDQPVERILGGLHSAAASQRAAPPVPASA